MNPLCPALPKPFWVIATQNPLFQSGTYALPESQLDRFLMRLSLGYPSRHAEKLLLQQESRFALIASLAHIFTEDEILDLQSLAHQVFMTAGVPVSDVLANSLQHDGLVLLMQLP